jgi:hypothetical protein
MSKPSFNTNRREHANAAAGDGAVKPIELEPLWDF